MNLRALSVLPLVALSLAVSACGTSSAESTNAPGDDVFAGCDKGTLEPDSKTLQPLSGPGVDPATGKIKAGSYVAAATYLAMVPDQLTHVFEISGPIIAAFQSTKGLVGVMMAQSDKCMTLRTLTVWDSEEEMTAFVASAAHAAAMGEVSAVSRGQSNTINWASKGDDITFAASAKKLAVDPKGDF